MQKFAVKNTLFFEVPNNKPPLYFLFYVAPYIFLCKNALLKILHPINSCDRKKSALNGGKEFTSSMPGLSSRRNSVTRLV
jgi:hypothetical protein